MHGIPPKGLHPAFQQWRRIHSIAVGREIVNRAPDLTRDAPESARQVVASPHAIDAVFDEIDDAPVALQPRQSIVPEVVETARGPASSPDTS
jgi:hypothetical protein